jgi:hypothetical protein
VKSGGLVIFYSEHTIFKTPVRRRWDEKQLRNFSRGNGNHRLLILKKNLGGLSAAFADVRAERSGMQSRSGEIWNKLSP